MEVTVHWRLVWGRVIGDNFGGDKEIFELRYFHSRMVPSNDPEAN